jgi:hypothetical protein
MSGEITCHSRKNTVETKRAKEVVRGFIVPGGKRKVRRMRKEWRFMVLFIWIE